MFALKYDLNKYACNSDFSENLFALQCHINGRLLLTRVLKKEISSIREMHVRLLKILIFMFKNYYLPT